MRPYLIPVLAVVAVCTLWLGGRPAAADGGEITVAGERLDPATYGPGVVESMATVMIRDLSTPRPLPKGRNGEHGEWVVPTMGATTAPHSPPHNVVNEWGDTRMGIGFPALVNVRGAWFAGQAGSGAWTTGIQVVGYRDGQRVAATDWFRQMGAEPAWMPMDLDGVDRIEVVAEPVIDAAGWYSMDDLTYSLADSAASSLVVVDFDDLDYATTLTATGYAGLTWEIGTGDFEINEGVPAPQRPAGRHMLEPEPAGIAAQASGTRGLPPQLMSSFRGVIRGDAGSSSYPPDTIGAIGPNHYVETVNRNFAVYDRVTGQQLTNVLLGSFLPGSNGDPRVLFDQHSGRWIVLVTDFSGGAHDYIAVSLTDNAMGSWFKTSFLTAQGSDAGKWPDYPTLGVDANGIYTCSYMVGGANVMTIFAIDKAPLIAASPSLGTVTAFRGLPWEGAIQPAHTYGNPPGEYLVSYSGSSSLRVRRVNPPLTAPTLTEVGMVTVPSFSAPPNAPALGSSTPLNTVDQRLMMSVYRDGSLWTAHTISVTGNAACRWYQINVASLSLTQWGNVAASNMHYFFPAIMVNEQGHAVMGFTGSNAAQYAGCYFAGRRASDPLGEMSTPVQYKAGTGPQNNIDGYGRNRWGDYSYTTLDPVDQRTMWTIQEYGHASDIWGTYVAALSTGPAPPVAQPATLSTAVSTALTASLQASDDGEPDPPGALTYIVQTLPQYGSLLDVLAGPITVVPYVLSAGGQQVIYQPTTGYSGADSFTFKASDGGTPPDGGESSPATVAITVGGPSWDPVAYDGTASTAVNQTVNIALSAVDPNGDQLTYVLQSLPHLGLLLDAGNPEAGPIAAVPYALAGVGHVVQYLPPCGLSPQTSFTFLVHDATAMSNVATVSVTVSASAPRAAFSFPMDTNPGWSTEGQWAFGQPLGGGTHGFDPTSGHTGSNVYGYNLAGDYANDEPASYLTMPAIDCSRMTSVELRFWRWLGVERFDDATVEVSNDGHNWTTVWQRPDSDSVSDRAWAPMQLDLSTVADAHSQVWIRWGMGPTDGSITYPGWNIDDVEIWAIVGVLAADFNGDGLVNGVDFGVFAGCETPPDGAATLGCRCVDIDGDGDVDLADFAAFQAAVGSS